MIFLKPVQKPARLLKLEAIAKRLPGHHAIQEALARETAGFKGEQAAAYFLSEISTPDTYALHNIRLKGGPGHFFQIDLLAATPAGFTIFETKHIARTLHYNEQTRQFDRGHDHFANPIHQLNRQIHLFSHWAENIPVTGKIVFTNDTIQLQNIKGIEKHFIYPYEIPSFLPTKRSIPTNIKPILQKLIQFHREDPHNPLRYYSINPAHIQPGIICPCGHRPMLRHRRTWNCPSCRHQNKNVHIEALQEYKTIYGPAITTKQAANFLQTTQNTAYTILKNHHTHTSGSYKDKVYFM